MSDTSPTSDVNSQTPAAPITTQLAPRPARRFWAGLGMTYGGLIAGAGGIAGEVVSHLPLASCLAGSDQQLIEVVALAKFVNKTFGPGMAAAVLLGGFGIVLTREVAHRGERVEVPPSGSSNLVESLPPVTPPAAGNTLG